MERRLILLIACTLMVCGFASAVFADNVIRKEFTPVDETPRWVEDEFIVVLKPAFKSGFDIQHDKRANKIQVSIASMQQLVNRHGVTGMGRQFAAAAAPELEAYYTVKLAPGQDLDMAAAAFASDPSVDHVEKIGIHPLSANCATGTPRPANDIYYNAPPPTFNWPQWDLWNTKGIDAELAWTVQDGDATVVVVAMDSGVKYTHQDLGGTNPPGPADNSTNGNVWVNPFEIPGNGIDDEGNGYIDDVVGYDFVTGVTGCASGEDCSTIDNNPMDFNGHGTHVAGTMAAITNNAKGVAGVAGGFGDGTTGSVGNGCKVMCMRIGWSDAAGNGFVNMSFAAQAINYVVGMKQRGVNVAAINCSWGSSNSGGIAAALDAAMSNDILVCKAAGNSNSSVADYMGNRTEILVVAATTTTGTRASFSNFGSWVDIAAPGVAIISTYQVGTDPVPDYVAVLDGTSMASPHCAGVAGLLESQNTSLTRAQKFSLMTGNVCAASSPNIGSGILNAKKALDAAGGGGPQPPVAAFTGSPTTGCAPLTVNFTDQSTNTPTSWSWTFGDGGTSTAQNPSYQYTTAGTYTVTLTATNASGSDGETKTNYITVSSTSTIVANFSGTPVTGAAPLNVTFTDLSTGGPTSWAWTFGDGGTSTAQNPSYTYTTAGTYNVSLTASSACASDGETKVAYVTVTAPAQSCDDFTDNNITNWGNSSGTWTASSGAMHGNSATTNARRTSPFGSFAGALTIECDMRINAQRQDREGRVIWGYVDANNYRFVLGDDDNNRWRFYSRVGGTNTLLATFNSTVTAGQWYDVKVSVAANGTATLSVNGTAVLSHAYGSSVTGLVGVGFSRANVDFDNYCVSSGASSLDPVAISPMASADPLPRSFALEQNYPNPFNAGTNITFTLTEGGDVELVVYDILGRTVRNLAAGFHAEGPHTVAFDGRDEHGNPLSSGVYIYRLVGSSISQTRKMVLLK